MTAEDAVQIIKNYFKKQIDGAFPEDVDNILIYNKELCKRMKEAEQMENAGK